MKQLLGVLAITYLLTACGSSEGQPRDDLADAAVEAANDAGTDSASPATSVSETLKATGPIEGGRGVIESIPITDFHAVQYREEEYFFEGQAIAYAVDGDMAVDGRWKLSEASKAPFRSRLFVRRPIDAAKFNGTVVVEWLNVSGGVDADPGYMYNHPMALREGWVWVGVSAQVAGVDATQGLSLTSLTGLLGGEMAAPTIPANAGPMPAPLKQFDPERYASLMHPGDEYSFDIFTKAGQVVRGEGGMDVLDGLKPERLIGYGESQSAGRMTSYVDGVAPLTTVFDGYFIHSRGASGTSFGKSGFDLSSFLGGGTPHNIRSDLTVPVFQFQTETDVHGQLKYLPARQPDTSMLRTWEVAGTAHADKYLTSLSGGAAVPGSFDCPGANDGPQRFVIRAALRALDRWIAQGVLPAQGQPLMVDASGAPVLDDYGNTRGGVRSPDVDVPIAIQSGIAADGGTPNLGGGIGGAFCGIFGSTIPFAIEQLTKLYPTHADYVTKVEESAKSAVRAGFLLEEEQQEILTRAEAASVP